MKSLVTGGISAISTRSAAPWKGTRGSTPRLPRTSARNALKKAVDRFIENGYVRAK